MATELERFGDLVLPWMAPSCHNRGTVGIAFLGGLGVNEQHPTGLETDPRFPSGPWVGFFLQREAPGRQAMELHLVFRDGRITGDGRDGVGPFAIRGQYNVDDGQCSWTKRYQGQHDVTYKGCNDGKGIWGAWEFPFDVDKWSCRGSFHIWPKGRPEPGETRFTEEAFESIPTEELT